MQDDAPTPGQLCKILAEVIQARREAEALLKQLDATIEELTAKVRELDPPTSDDRD